MFETSVLLKHFGSAFGNGGRKEGRKEGRQEGRKEQAPFHSVPFQSIPFRPIGLSEANYAMFQISLNIFAKL